MSALTVNPFIFIGQASVKVGDVHLQAKTLPEAFYIPSYACFWAFQLPPTTGCSPTTRAVAGHEPECKFCNTAGMFLQIQVT